MEVFNATVTRIAPGKNPRVLRAPQPPSYLDPRALDHFHAGMWLQTMCILEVGYSIPQEEFYKDYTYYCTLNSLNPVPLTDLLKLVAKIHGETVLQSEPSCILNIKPKKEALKEDEEVTNDVSNNIEKLNGFWEAIKSGAYKGTTCPWSQKKFANRDLMIQHFKTYLPDEPVTVVKESITETKPKIFPDPHDELKGIPLCAFLVIRNIAKHPQNHSYFAPFEKDLAAMLTNAKYNKTAASVLAELK
jgi:hypothetical protein